MVGLRPTLPAERTLTRENERRRRAEQLILLRKLAAAGWKRQASLSDLDVPRCGRAPGANHHQVQDLVPTSQGDERYGMLPEVHAKALMRKLDDDTLKQVARALEQCAGLVAGYVFGSQVDPNRDAPRDLDIAILGTRPRTLQEILEVSSSIAKIIGCDRLDVVDLRAAGSVLKYQVVTTGKMLFCKDERATNEFELQVLREYRDSAYRRRVQFDLLRDSLAK